MLLEKILMLMKFVASYMSKQKDKIHFIIHHLMDLVQFLAKNG